MVFARVSSIILLSSFVVLVFQNCGNGFQLPVRPNYESGGLNLTDTSIDYEDQVGNAHSTEVCEYNNEVFNLGDRFPAEDGCNQCTCIASEEGPAAACTEMACLPDTCQYEERDYEIGESFPDKDGCNTCSCTEGGLIACTEKACYNPKICNFDGKIYEAGEIFEANDKCNTCTCTSNGQVACTKKACFLPFQFWNIDTNQ